MFVMTGENAGAASAELILKSADDELGIYSTTDRCRGDGKNIILTLNTDIFTVNSNHYKLNAISLLLHT